MKHFLKKYNKVFLIAGAFIFAGIVVGSFVWGILDLSKQIDQAVIFTPTSQNAIDFDLAGAAGLNLRGLLQE